MRDRIKVLSLFTGAGGLDLGFHMAGFDIIACVDIDKLCCATVELNRGPSKYFSKECQVFPEDIAVFNVSELATTDIDFVIGGTPCQAFSASGRRVGGAPGINDERGQLFENYCEILKRIKPRGFLFENVRGLLYVDHGKTWDMILNAFSRLGYRLSYRLLDAADYGVPQHRERIILVGSKEDKFLFPRPFYGPDSKNHTPHVTAWEAVKDLQDLIEPYHEYNGKYGKLLTDIPEGMNYSFYTREMGHPKPVFAWRSKFSDFLYKAARDRPIKTLQAKLGKFSGPFHWKNRRMTASELKRLQSFPDDYEFAGSYNRIAEQIGNSVPPLFAQALAKAVVKQFFDKNSFPDLELLPIEYRLSFDRRKGKIATKTRQITSHHTSNVIQQKFTYPSVTKRETRYVVYTNPVTKSSVLTETDLEAVRAEYLRKSSGHIECFKVETSLLGGKLVIKTSECDKSEELDNPGWRVKLHLQDPLDGGIIHIESTIYSQEDSSVHIAWDLIEDEIKRRSSYVSLVGLYGHFAEPKIKMSITVENIAGFSSGLARMVEFFSIPANCGVNIPYADLLEKTGGEYADLASMRYIRYDIRSNLISRNIPADQCFCSYPFPVLDAEYQILKPVLDSNTISVK